MSRDIKKIISTGLAFTLCLTCGGALAAIDTYFI